MSSKGQRDSRGGQEGERERGWEDLGRLPEAEINNILFPAVLDIFVPMNVYRTLLTEGEGLQELLFVCDTQQHVRLITRGTRIIRCDWNFMLFLLRRCDLHRASKVECSTLLFLF